MIQIKDKKTLVAGLDKYRACRARRFAAAMGRPIMIPSPQPKFRRVFPPPAKCFATKWRQSSDLLRRVQE